MPISVSSGTRNPIDMGAVPLRMGIREIGRVAAVTVAQVQADAADIDVVEINPAVINRSERILTCGPLRKTVFDTDQTKPVLVVEFLGSP